MLAKIVLKKRTIQCEVITLMKCSYPYDIVNAVYNDTPQNFQRKLHAQKVNVLVKRQRFLGRKSFLARTLGLETWISFPFLDMSRKRIYVFEARIASLTIFRLAHQIVKRVCIVV